MMSLTLTFVADYSDILETFQDIDDSQAANSAAYDSKASRFDQLLEAETYALENPVDANAGLLIIVLPSVFGAIFIAGIFALAYCITKIEKYKKRVDFRHRMDDHEMQESTRLTKKKSKIQKARNNRVEEEIESDDSLPISDA